MSVKSILLALISFFARTQLSLSNQSLAWHSALLQNQLSLKRHFM